MQKQVLTHRTRRWRPGTTVHTLVPAMCQTVQSLIKQIKRSNQFDVKSMKQIFFTNLFDDFCLHHLSAAAISRQ